MKKNVLIQTLLLLLFFRVIPASAQYTKIYDFAGNPDGAGPYGDLVYDGTTYLYGMTPSGGVNDMGTIFKIKPDGTGYLKIFDFAGASNGSYPYGSLMYDGITYLYGMTWQGGANSLGVLFKIKPDGTGYTKLLDFAGASNGSDPWGNLIYDGIYLYGMTGDGGTSAKGTIFKIKPDGTGYVKLLNFSGAANGANPQGTLLYDGTYLYGLTYGGGTNSDGVVFKIKPDGTGYVKLLDFAGANGYRPYAALIYDGTYLYGMTEIGGTNNDGVVFKIKPDGTGYVKLLDFAGGSNGSITYGSLVYDGTYLYGMTTFGSPNSDGLIFRIKPDGTGYSDLWDFDDLNPANGASPYGSLLFIGSCLYGMTSGGGVNSMGTIFGYCPPVLATEMVSFTGEMKSNAAFLQWSTASETNSDYFQIEKSYDGKKFEATGKVKASGNSTTPHEYYYTDRLTDIPFPIGEESWKGEAYYRLKQFDFNGSFTCSNTIKMTQPSNHQIRIYPVPAQRELYCEFYADRNTDIKTSVVDVMGKEVLKEIVKAARGRNIFKLDISSLPQGMYFFRTGDIQAKFIKQ